MLTVCYQFAPLQREMSVLDASWIQLHSIKAVDSWFEEHFDSNCNFRGTIER